MYLPAEEEELLELAHSMGHFAAGKTLQRLTAEYWWEDMARDVEEWTRSCPVCQARAKPQHKFGLLHSIQVPQEPFELIGADVVSGLPDADGISKALIVTDYFTKMADAYPIKDERAPTVARALMNWIERYGPPTRIIHDRG